MHRHDDVRGGPGAAVHMIPRPRLVARLERADRVAVLTGLDGSGRRTVVTEWLGASPGRFAMWVQPAADAGPAALWAEAAAQLDASAVRPAAAGDPGPGTAADQVRDRLLRIGSPVLVLDCTVGWRPAGLDDLLHELVGAVAGLRVVVVAEDAAVVGRLARGATVLRAPELAFHRDEVVTLLGRHGLPEALAGAVHDALGGWPGPTQALLAELSPDEPDLDRAITRLDPVVREAVLHSAAFADPATRRLLLRTAVVEDVTADIADALLEVPAARTLFDQLLTTAPFPVRSGSGDAVLRLPDRVRAVCYALLAAEEPSAPRELHARMAQFFAERDNWYQATEQAHAAGDHATVSRMLDRHWHELLIRYPLRAAQWVHDFPEEFVERNPRYTLLRDQIFPMRYELSSRDTLLRLHRGGGSDLPIRDVVVVCLGRVLSARWTSQLGPLAEALDDLDRWITRRAVEWESEIERELRAFVRLQTGIARMHLGTLRRAGEDLRTAFHAAAGTAVAYLARDAAGNLALVCALTGDLRGAKEWVGAARRLPEATGLLAGIVEHRDVLAEALIAVERGEQLAAEAAMERYVPAAQHDEGWGWEAYVQARVGLGGEQPLAAHIMLEQARARARHPLDERALPALLLTAVEAELLLALGQEGRAGVLLDAAPDHPVLGVVRARRALLLGRTDEVAAQVAAGLVDGLAASLFRIDLHLMEAATALTAGQPGRAVAAREVAVRVARKHGALGPFLRLPRGVLEGLAAGAGQTTATTDLLRRALERKPVFPERLQSPGLSGREVEVLAELVRTPSHQLIARRLFVSVNTVKTHLRSVYRKLGVGSREEALRTAADLGLLPEGRVDGHGEGTPSTGRAVLPDGVPTQRGGRRDARRAPPPRDRSARPT